MRLYLPVPQPRNFTVVPVVDHQVGCAVGATSSQYKLGVAADDAAWGGLITIKAKLAEVETSLWAKLYVKRHVA
jgi:hypothetical protein